MSKSSKFFNFLHFCRFCNISTALPEQKSVWALISCWYSFFVILQAACYSRRIQKTVCLQLTASVRKKLIYFFRYIGHINIYSMIYQLINISGYLFRMAILSYVSLDMCHMLLVWKRYAKKCCDMLDTYQNFVTIHNSRRLLDTYLRFHDFKICFNT